MSADLKAFQVICSIKDDYGEKMDWLLPYLADIHILMNYFVGVLGRRWHAGVEKALAEIYKKNTLESIKKFTNFSRTLNAVLLLDEAPLRLFLETDEERIKDKKDEERNRLISQIRSANVALEEGNKDIFLSRLKTAEDVICYTVKAIDSFVIKSCSSDLKFQSCTTFLTKELVFSYGLLIAGRTKNWELCVVSLKCMLGVFAATGRVHYSQELLKHMYHLSTIFTDYVLDFFRSGGFSNALSENSASAVFIDETHETTLNKDMALQAHHDISKGALEISALYMPFRATMNRN